MFKISFANRFASLFPQLKTHLRIAHLSDTPVSFVSKNLKSTILYSFLFAILFFFVLKRAKAPLFLIVPIFFALMVALFYYSLLNLKAKIKKREREINKEVIFIGRFLLVKIYSGRPLLNALIETAESKGVASKYIKEIVDDINTGNTIEDALNNAMIYSPSDKLRKIFFYVNNALQLGIDVTKPLEAVIQELTQEEELEIKKYGKKLNTLVIFYMLGAIVVPSLGLAMFIILSSFINLTVDLKWFSIFLFFIVVLQFIYIALFKSIRPMINL